VDSLLAILKGPPRPRKELTIGRAGDVVRKDKWEYDHR
jgi:hypothetical protein